MSAEQKSLSLSGNTLKIIAALSMVSDHIGIIFFPKILIFRILGRLAFPIFAFMIAEGCLHTRSRAKYFGSIFVLGALCQIVYSLAMNNFYICILLTFALSVLIIFAIQDFKKLLLEKKLSPVKKLFAALVPAALIAGVWLLSRYIVLDYGFWGCMCPVFAALLHPWADSAPAWTRNPRIHTACMCIPLLLLTLEFQWVQPFCFAALPLLLLYSGRRGRRKMKYFFYIFYPAHLALLQGIAYLIE